MNNFDFVMGRGVNMEAAIKDLRQIILDNFAVGQFALGSLFALPELQAPKIHSMNTQPMQPVYTVCVVCLVFFQDDSVNGDDEKKGEASMMPM